PFTMGCVNFTIREYRPQDFDTLWRIDQECFPPGISYSRLELAVYMRRAASFTLIAVSPIEILGFIVATCNRKRMGHIITIDVRQDARRLRVGSGLLKAAEKRLRTARSSWVELETAVDNMAALAFYKRHGYDLVKTIPRYYSNGVDALVLRKDLLSASEGS
ncbi:MAG: hypothetical protein DMG73_11075, partial [Acidobacteria bacterium]